VSADSGPDSGGFPVEAFSRITKPDHTHHAFRAAALAQIGDATGPKAHAAEVMRRDPGFTVEGYLATLHYRQEEDREHHRQALLASGLPASAAAP
jgi:adenylate cyclase